MSGQGASTPRGCRPARLYENRPDRDCAGLCRKDVPDAPLGGKRDSPGEVTPRIRNASFSGAFIDRSIRGAWRGSGLALSLLSPGESWNFVETAGHAPAQMSETRDASTRYIPSRRHSEATEECANGRREQWDRSGPDTGRTTVCNAPRRLSRHTIHDDTELAYRGRPGNWWATEIRLAGRAVPIPRPAAG
jgi:hypothetical protein